MLDEHALNGFFREIGIDGLTAEGVEVVECLNERRIALALVVYGFLDGVGELGDAHGEFFDRVLPLFNVRGFVIEELVDDINQLLGIGDVLVANADAGLVQNDALG